MNDAVRLPVGLGVIASAVLVGAASLLPWRSSAGIEGVAGQVSVLLAIALGVAGVAAIHVPSARRNWLVAFVLAVLILIVATGQVISDADAPSAATCDDLASCAHLVLAPAGVGIGLVAVIVGCLLAGTTALLGARRPLI